jgi:hypothetical protein
MSFEATGLDPRILRALSKRGFITPTLVQVGSSFSASATRRRCAVPPAFASSLLPLPLDVD